jgi:23S rRNA (pseudouridine1915-N3)-methyltransferase
MRIKLLSVGSVKKASPFHDLFETYAKRMNWALETVEVDARKNQTSEQQEARLLPLIPDDAYIFALDERGKTLSSIEFTRHIQQLESDNRTQLCFIIGGADGLTENIRKKADFLLSFGKQTWPHQLVRVMLIEQIYRAQQISAGHPYHRE